MNTLDRFRGLKIHTAVSTTEKGNKYTCFAVGGLVPEGNNFGHWCMSKEDVIYAFNRDFDRIAAENRGKKILWRKLPEVIERIYYDDTTFNNSGYGIHLEAVTFYQVIARFAYE